MKIIDDLREISNEPNALGCDVWCETTCMGRVHVSVLCEIADRIISDKPGEITDKLCQMWEASEPPFGPEFQKMDRHTRWLRLRGEPPFWNTNQIANMFIVERGPFRVDPDEVSNKDFKNEVLELLRSIALTHAR